MHEAVSNHEFYRKAPIFEISFIYLSYRISAKPSSWFIGDYVQEDGTFYLATPMDPLFLALPALEKGRNAVREKIKMIKFYGLANSVANRQFVLSVCGSLRLPIILVTSWSSVNSFQLQCFQLI